MKKWIAFILVLCLGGSLAGCDLLDSLFQGSAGGGNYTEATAAPIPELIDLSGTSKVSSFYEDYYVLTGVTADQVEGYVATIHEAGYATGIRYTLKNCTDVNFLQYLYTTGIDSRAVYIGIYKDTMVVGYDLPFGLAGELWKAAGAPEALYAGDFSVTPEECKTMPDWSQAVNVTVGSYACRLLYDVPYQLVENYGNWLWAREDYERGAIGDNRTQVGELYAQTFWQEDKREECQVVMWANNVALLTYVPDQNQIDEYLLWDCLGADVIPGGSYLAEFMIYVKSGIPGSGHGSDGGDGQFSYAPNCTVEDYEYYKGRIAELGFVERTEETIDGDYREYIAAKYAPVGQRVWVLYYQIILDGDYLELELDYTVTEGSHKD